VRVPTLHRFFLGSYFPSGQPTVIFISRSLSTVLTRKLLGSKNSGGATLQCLNFLITSHDTLFSLQNLVKLMGGFGILVYSSSSWYILFMDSLDYLSFRPQISQNFIFLNSGLSFLSTATANAIFHDIPLAHS
jgi:hypothetical protein